MNGTLHPRFDNDIMWIRKGDDYMTDSEKLDLLIAKVITIDDKVGTLDDKFGTFEDKFDTLTGEVGILTGKVETLEGKVGTLTGKVETLEGEVGTLTSKVETLEHDVPGLKEQMIKSTKELKTMDKAILDEIERVHDILNKHKSDKNAHITLLRYE